MSTPVWQAGKLYVPGSLVQPARQPGPSFVALENPDFEDGDTGWTKGGSWAINNNPGYSGAWCAQFPGSGTGELINNAEAPVSPGQTVTASCMCKPSTGSDAARAKLYWYDASHTMISASDGSLVQGSGSWRQSTVSGRAPANAAFVRAGVSTSKGSGTVVSADRFAWTLPYPERVEGLIYKAVQPAAGTSGAAEPDWPLTLGVQVTDNEVIWEGVLASRVVWQAHPILTSGADEPTWPTVPGEFVSDNTISWEAISRRVEDPRCPQSKVVAIMAGKVFAADGDIVRFSATANPLDWSSADDAGYLPTGLQQANGNDMAVLAPYRSNLAAFNASSFQMWQVDPDPAAMALLDQMEGIGSTWPKAAQAVGDELFFLSALGVRSVGVAAGTTNLQAGDIGTPIDPLLQTVLADIKESGEKPIATYYPGGGQYWLAFRNYPQALSVSGNHPNGYVGQDLAPYAYTAVGGVKPYQFSISQGELPAGRALSFSGVAAGPLEAPGEFAWDVRVTDAAGNIATVADTADITDEVWLASYDGPATSDRAAFATLAGDWRPGFTPGLIGRVYRSDDGYYVATPDVPNSVVRSSSRLGPWTSTGPTGSVSSGGGRMAFIGQYQFLCGGVTPMKRRATGAWAEPSADSLSRATDVLAYKSTLVSVFHSRLTTAISTSLGASWVAGDLAYTDGLHGFPKLATDNDRIAVLYGTGSPYHRIRIKFSSDGGRTFGPTAYEFPTGGLAIVPQEIAWTGAGWLATTSAGETAYCPQGGSFALLDVSLGPVHQIAVGSTKLLVASGNGHIYTAALDCTDWQQMPLPPGAVGGSIAGVAWTYRGQG